ncbi:MAG: moaA/nirJ/pqqE cofactor biosynthesis protein [Candidatus Scalindua rubra]|uniref:MoaA/nirJ/pqqE cofactor biosynthesis protein n=1 Tax=Candidatus Scalindua rubra TaxID=1872076 RepID=A0A1E3XFJ4_9BACT|nr:MAG: moaA/nirJ/pqqE cofactor biosynthesis protein [Candidatus Scalindua rubra]
MIMDTISNIIKMSRRNPFSDVKMMKWVTRLFSFQIDGRLNTGYSFSPYLIHLMPTYLCNLRCKKCGQWGETGNYYKKDANFLRENMNIDVFEELINDVSKFSPTIFITGGEPFYYKDIIRLIKYIKQKNLICWIITNGTLLENYANDIVKLGVDVLYISIDGPEDAHNKIRDVHDGFQKISSGIKKIINAKEKMNKQRPLLCQVFTISDLSFPYLENITDTTEKLGFEMLLIKHPYFNNTRTGRNYENLMGRSFQCYAPSWQGWVDDEIKIDPHSLQKSISQLLSKKYKFQLAFFPAIKVSDIPHYYSTSQDIFYNGSKSRKKIKRCIAPWTHIMIYPNGDAVFCNDNPDYILGNIKSERFSEIWNSSKSRKFRKFIKNNFLPICSRCCGLYYHPFYRSGSSLRTLAK